MTPKMLLPLALLATAPAMAQSDDEKPPEPVVLKNIPPRFSWDFAIQASYSMLPQFNAAPAWMGLGARATWGKHFGNHRIGPNLTISFEGPIAIQWGNYFEPSATWDFVGERKLWIGATLGVSLIANSELGAQSNIQTSFDIGPMAAFRIGYSTPYSILMKRFFVGVEPKLRIVQGSLPSFGAAVMIGTGFGY